MKHLRACLRYRRVIMISSTQSTLCRLTLAPGGPRSQIRALSAAFSLRRRVSPTSTSTSTSTLSHRPFTTLPLSNLRVLDLTRVLAGPFCTQILADYGATVLKIEQPGSGDETRQWRTAGETAQMWDDQYLTKANAGAASGPLMSLYFASVNRNKRSMTINLKSERGRSLVKQMLDPTQTEAYDIVVHNFMPGKMDDMGLGFDELKIINPALIYASVSGYGVTGPSSRRAGYDAIALAEAGLLHITGTKESGPTKPGVAIADLCTGLYTHGAILSAVNARVQTGQGCKIDASLFESSLSLLINVGLASVNLDLTDPQKRRRGGRMGLGHPNLVPYGGYKTKDGRQLFVAANNNRQWKLFTERLGLDPEFVEEYSTNDKRVENRKRIDKALSNRFAEKDLREWEAVFEGSGLPYGPVNDVVEALEHLQAKARDMVLPVEGIRAARGGKVKLIGSAVKFNGGAEKSGLVRRKPPLLGEHTEEVLQEMGFNYKEIAAMRREGTI